jgi:hypothetical protein
MAEDYSAAVGTLKIPQENETGYVTGANSLRATLILLGDSCYSAGNQVPTAGLQNDAVTADKILDGTITAAKLASDLTLGVVANDTFFQSRNQANSADIDLFKLNTSDLLQIDAKISQLRLANNTSITARDNADSSYKNLMKLNTSDDIEFGEEIGAMNLKHNTSVTGRNAADNADVSLFKINSSDELEVETPLTAAGVLHLNIGASGDPKIVFDINGTDEWHIGVDDSDGDKLKIGTGAAVGTNAALEIDANGLITKPLQCGFEAQANGTLSNVTGNGTAYTVVFGNEIYDRNSDFDGTSTFTAPVTGIYDLGVGLGISGMTSSSTGIQIYFLINGSDRKYVHLETGSFVNDSSLTLVTNRQVSLTAGDTVVVIFYVVGEGSDVVDLSGAADEATFFSGRLIL